MGERKAVIRNARPEEWELLADIEAECFPPAEAATRESIEKRMRLFPENFWVAESEGNILGFINGGTTDKPELPDAFYHEEEKLHMPDGAYQTVFGLNVRPQYRRQGLARQLVMQMIEAARQRGEERSYFDMQGAFNSFLFFLWVCESWSIRVRTRRSSLV